MGWLDDNHDAVVVAVAEPVEGHVELVINNHNNKNHYNNCSGVVAPERPDMVTSFRELR